jgi:hypothetical protein
MYAKRRMDSYSDFFHNETIKNNIREILKLVGETIYNEINVYLWIIGFYNIFLALIILSNLYLMLRLSNKLSKVTYLEK